MGRENTFRPQIFLAKTIIGFVLIYATILYQIYVESFREKSHYDVIMPFLKTISKVVALIVIFCDNFPNFCPIDVFSLEMDSQL